MNLQIRCNARTNCHFIKGLLRLRLVAVISVIYRETLFMYLRKFFMLTLILAVVGSVGCGPERAPEGSNDPSKVPMPATDPPVPKH